MAMTPAIYRGIVQGGVVVAGEDKLPWKDGTEVFVTAVTAPAVDPAAILASFAAAPPVPPDWVDELEKLIDQGERPGTNEDPFSAETGTEEDR